MPRFAAAILLLSALCSTTAHADPFTRGEAIELDRAIPANERGIMCLLQDDKGNVYGGTTGRAAHLLVYDMAKESVRSLARLEGGIGFAHALLRLPDGSLIGGTQADPTGIAVKTDPKAVGHLYRFTINGEGPAKIEDLGVPVSGQGIYTLAYLEKTNEICGNTWPDGHFFTYDLKEKKYWDFGAIAGYRTYEHPQHAKDLNLGTNDNIDYPRQVSRAIAVDEKSGAYTAGENGILYRYDFATRKLEKLGAQLPAAKGRESWASLHSALVQRYASVHGERRRLIGGTSDGYLFEIDLTDKGTALVRSLGKPFAHGAIQALQIMSASGIFSGVITESDLNYNLAGVADNRGGMPRTFSLTLGPQTGTVVTPGGIPHVNGQLSMVGIGAMVSVSGNEQGKFGHDLFAGERDRIARLVRFPLLVEEPAKTKKKQAAKARPPFTDPRPADTSVPPKLDGRVVFAPLGTTTDGSGYTALEVGKDGLAYVGAARYGGYAWLLRFDPAAKPLFMDKVVNMRQLTGEQRSGINTQGKIHAKIIVGADGRVWFASKQAHESFEQRPEFGEDADGFPGGHLCYFDPKTGFSRSMGILKKQEGLMGGVIDDARGKLYYRSEPKNNFLVYDIKTGDVQDRGHVGAACRYSAIDKNGAVYNPGRGNYLARYDPTTGYIEDLLIKLEGEGTYLAPYVIGLGPNGKLYGVGAGHPWLLEFDIDTYKPGPFPEVTVRNVAFAAPAGMPVQDIHAGVFGQDGRFYYPLNTTGVLEAGGKPEAHVRIMRFDPQTKKVETVGVPRFPEFDESKVKHAYQRGANFKFQHMQGAAISADGSLFLMGIYPQLYVGYFPQLTAAKK
jgi:hypothetical protein